MKIKAKIALVIGVIALLFLVGWTSKAESSSKTDWEYKAVTIWQHPNNPQHNMNQFNNMGGEGWELVTVTSVEVGHGGGEQVKLTCYFKRPL